MTSALGTISFGAALVLYAAAAALYYWEVARGTPPPRSGSWSARLLGLAALAHLATVMVASFVAHVCPVYSSDFFLSIASLVATGVYLAARRRFRLHALGMVVAPIGLVLAATILFPRAESSQVRLPASFIGFHVFANLCGAALFLLAAGAAVMYLLQERRLKRKHTAPSESLPSLDALDKAMHRFLLAGYPLFTVGLAMGSIWMAQLPERSADVLVRTTLGWATWLVFGAVLLLRVLAGWRGRRAAYGTVTGFACTLAVVSVYLIRPWLRGLGG